MQYENAISFALKVLSQNEEEWITILNPIPPTVSTGNDGQTQCSQVVVGVQLQFQFARYSPSQFSTISQNMATTNLYNISSVMHLKTLMVYVYSILINRPFIVSLKIIGQYSGVCTDLKDG